MRGDVKNSTEDDEVTSPNNKARENSYVLDWLSNILLGFAKRFAGTHVYTWVNVKSFSSLIINPTAKLRPLWVAWTIDLPNDNIT